MDNNKTLYICIVGLFIFFLLVYIGSSCQKSQEREFFQSLFKDWNEINKTRKVAEPDEEDYNKKCWAARAVYQYSWFKQYPSKLGKLNLEKRYCMDSKNFDEIVELSCKLSKYINIFHQPQIRFFIFAKWIMESSINMRAQHNTGEIIKLTGYTPAGFARALYHYKYDLRIDASSPLYIPELYDRNCNIDLIFQDMRNVVKFDYAYIWYLLQKYKGRWDKVLTAFHWSEDQVDIWDKTGLDRIPNYRFEGSKIWMPEYYKTVCDIAYGIEAGRMERIDGFEKIVQEFKQHAKYQDNYIACLQIKFKQQECVEKLEKKIQEVTEDFAAYKKLISDQMWKQNQLNEVNYDIRSGIKDIKLMDMKQVLGSEIKAIQKEIKRRFK